jgi:transposase
MGPKRDRHAPPVPLGLICTRLTDKVSPREARAITRRLSTNETPTRAVQILALLTIVRDELQYAWSCRNIGSIFNVHKGTVHWIRSQAMRDIEHDTGRPPRLSPDHETQLTDHTRTSFESCSPVSPEQVRAYVSETFGTQASSSWTWRFVTHDQETLQQATAYPQEDRRMKVTKEVARAHIRNLEQWVQNIPTELILNLDEVGVQDWADRKTRKVIIRRQARPRRIEYAVTRKEKRISCIATISMAGDVVVPLLVIHRKTIDDAVWEEGWRDGQDFLIRSNDSSYVTRTIFKEYLTQVVVPYYVTTRQSLNFKQFPGVLLCDNCASHVDDKII